MSAILCPSCGSDNCQSFSILNAHGTSVVNTSTRTAGVGVGRGGLGVGTAKSRTTGTQQTAVGAMTAAPAKKRLRWQVILSIVLVLFGLSKITHGIGIVMLIVGLALAYWGYTRLRYNQNVWPQLYSDWQLKFLCNKCGTVFVNQPSYTSPADEEVASTVE
ncbi:hypothetical protein [Alicyclobacillus sp. ALC3]|uniref:hypothetical protein n=1 Tax=Alicyclobacillus sp. ALC3 TaxID=2796143 RepID=UPI0023785E33|nr:hypothetical protein [Alicyclobacillus sp. ALC3]WDL99685.1 hypothetical protein JC200_23890 [Alicyclobacillus sp. ALC3]